MNTHKGMSWTSKVNLSVVSDELQDGLRDASPMITELP